MPDCSELDKLISELEEEYILHLKQEALDDKYVNKGPEAEMIELLKRKLDEVKNELEIAEEG